MSCSAAASIAAPLACPTAIAERTFLPKKTSSIAIAFGSCQAISSFRERWIRSSRRSRGWSGVVSTTPPSRATMWFPSTRTTPKPRFAAPGSMPITTCTGSDSRNSVGCLPLGGELLENVGGNVEVGVDLVDVVLVVERVEQLQNPLGVVPIQLDGAFRLRDQTGGLDLDPFAFERFPDAGQGGRLADHPQLVLVLAHILGAGVDRPDQIVLAVAAAVDDDRPHFLEDPGDGARLSEAAAVLGEGVANLGAGAVAIVGQRLDQHRDPGGPVALVDDPFDRRPVRPGTGADVDRFLDLVLRHRGVFRLLDGRRQSRVAGDVTAAIARGDGDRPRELAEELAAFRIGSALLVFDRVPLGMPGHRLPFYEVAAWH